MLQIPWTSLTDQWLKCSNRSNIQARFQASGLAHILASISTLFALRGDSLPIFVGDNGSSSQAEMSGSILLETEVSSCLVFMLRLIKPSLVSTGDDKARVFSQICWDRRTEMQFSATKIGEEYLRGPGRQTCSDLCWGHAYWCACCCSSVRWPDCREYSYWTASRVLVERCGIDMVLIIILILKGHLWCGRLMMIDMFLLGGCNVHFGQLLPDDQSLDSSVSWLPSW